MAQNFHVINFGVESFQPSRTTVQEELDPTVIPDPCIRQVPRWTTLPSPELPRTRPLPRMTREVKKGLMKGKQASARGRGAQSSIGSAGWKQVCILLHRPWRPESCEACPFQTFNPGLNQNSTEGYGGLLPLKFRGCRDHMENTNDGKVTAVQELEG